MKSYAFVTRDRYKDDGLDNCVCLWPPGVPPSRSAEFNGLTYWSSPGGVSTIICASWFTRMTGVKILSSEKLYKVKFTGKVVE